MKKEKEEIKKALRNILAKIIEERSGVKGRPPEIDKVEPKGMLVFFFMRYGTITFGLGKVDSTEILRWLIKKEAVIAIKLPETEINDENA